MLDAEVAEDGIGELSEEEDCPLLKSIIMILISYKLNGQINLLSGGEKDQSVKSEGDINSLSWIRTEIKAIEQRIHFRRTMGSTAMP